jgi:hypothetical protein
MFAIIFSLFHSIRQALRDRAALHAEILALRHRLLVRKRSKRLHKLQLSIADRTILGLLFLIRADFDIRRTA